MSDLVTVASPFDLEATLAALRSTIEANGAHVFDVIDHTAAARDAGLALRPTTVVVFGNPAAGTPLMEATPELGLDLPLKLLVWQADDGRVLVTYRRGDALVTEHGLDEAAAAVLASPGAVATHALGAS